MGSSTFASDEIFGSGAVGGGLFSASGFGDHAGLSGGSPLIKAEIVLNRGQESEEQVEPLYYYAHLNAEIAQGHVDIEFAPVGVKVHEEDNRIEGELIRTRVSREYALNQNFALRVTLFGGQATAMLPLWYAKGKHDLFVTLLLDALGYRLVSHLNHSELYQGFEVGRIGGEVGATVFPCEKLPVRLVFGGSGDLSVRLTSMDSEIEGHGSVRAEIRKWLRLSVDAQWVRDRDGESNETARARILRGTVLIVF
jgi:hypothetical protein